MSKCLISIIVPVYNVENYLRNCLDSILTCDYSDFEVLLINDGSTDHSGEICDEYADTDARVKVLHQSNRGVSYTRNKGLSVAQGEWIIFVDSDDEVECTWMRKVHELIDMYDADIIKYGYYIDSLTDTVPVVCNDREIDCLIKGSLNIYRSVEVSAYYGYLWNTVFKRELIADLRFDEKLSFCEDHLFTYNYISHVGTMLISPSPLYRYKKRSVNSLSKTSDPYMLLQAANKMLLVKLQIVSSDRDLLEYTKKCFNADIVAALKNIYLNERYKRKDRIDFYRLLSESASTSFLLPWIRIYSYSWIPLMIKDVIFKVLLWGKSLKK